MEISRTIAITKTCHAPRASLIISPKYSMIQNIARGMTSVREAKSLSQKALNQALQAPWK